MPSEIYKQALIDEIYDAFRAVNRSGGVSWSEAYVIDMYGSPKEREQARKKDKEASWPELVDSDWRDCPGVGGWSFLDPIGFRYYLPAAMVRGIRKGASDISFWLTPSAGKLDAWSLNKWSLLDERQRNCVKSFVSLMGECEREVAEGEWEADEWLEAREYWDQI